MRARQKYQWLLAGARQATGTSLRHFLFAKPTGLCRILSAKPANLLRTGALQRARTLASWYRVDSGGPQRVGVRTQAREPLAPRSDPKSPPGPSPAQAGSSGARRGIGASPASAGETPGAVPARCPHPRGGPPSPRNSSAVRSPDAGEAEGTDLRRKGASGLPGSPSRSSAQALVSSAPGKAHSPRRSDPPCHPKQRNSI